MASFPGAFATFGDGFRPRAAFAAKRLRRLLALWASRRRERLALAEMDERLLKDIGVDPITARMEAGRPFWEGGERPKVRWWA